MAAQITITGHLGGDPEKRQAGDNTVTALNVASKHRAKGRDGEWSDITTWYRVALWDRASQATAEKFARKGSFVIISGVLEPREYEKDGVTRYSMDVRGTSLEVPRMGDAPARAAAPAQSQSRHARPSDDDLPF